MCSYATDENTFYLMLMTWHEAPVGHVPTFCFEVSVPNTRTEHPSVWNNFMLFYILKMLSSRQQRNFVTVISVSLVLLLLFHAWL